MQSASAADFLNRKVAAPAASQQSRLSPSLRDNRCRTIPRDPLRPGAALARRCLIFAAWAPFVNGRGPGDARTFGAPASTRPCAGSPIVTSMSAPAAKSAPSCCPAPPASWRPPALGALLTWTVISTGSMVAAGFAAHADDQAAAKTSAYYERPDRRPPGAADLGGGRADPEHRLDRRPGRLDRKSATPRWPC